jgi:hypothetical protein
MRVLFVRTGGLAGLRLSLELDTEVMDSDSSAELRELVRNAGFYELPSHMLSHGRVRDAFQYRLRISASGLQDHEVLVDDDSAPPGLVPLLTHLTILALHNAPHTGP